ncbi:MAG: hypothetical protein H7836_17815 [Magnetococcus sp. YQC-3]
MKLMKMIIGKGKALNEEQKMQQIILVWQGTPVSPKFFYDKAKKSVAAINYPLTNRDLEFLEKKIIKKLLKRPENDLDKVYKEKLLQIIGHAKSNRSVQSEIDWIKKELLLFIEQCEVNDYAKVCKKFGLAI